MIWTRFYLNIKEVKGDYRPLVWPIKYPYWCSGETQNDFILVAYVESLDELYKQWPEAKNIDSEEVKKVTFTDRFPKPDWYTNEHIEQVKNKNLIQVVYNVNDYIKEKPSKQERFIKKFGYWWYIRDLDFLPQPCEDNMQAFKMSGKWLDLVKEGKWIAFNDFETACQASNTIRKSMGMTEYDFTEQIKYNKERVKNGR